MQKGGASRKEYGYRKSRREFIGIEKQGHGDNGPGELEIQQGEA